MICDAANVSEQRGARRQAWRARTDECEIHYRKHPRIKSPEMSAIRLLVPAIEATDGGQAGPLKMALCSLSALLAERLAGEDE